MNQLILITTVIIGSLSLVGALIFFNPSSLQQGSGLETLGTALGPLGSEHSHISISISVQGKLLDLAQPKYMLQNPFVHLENNDGFTVHKHATGVTLAFYLSTLGFVLSENCLQLDDGSKFCNTDSQRLAVLVEGEEIDNFVEYEIQHGERILVNYGDESLSELKSKFEEVPKIEEQFL